MIEALGLTKYYQHTPALRDISFSLSEQSILAVAGANGAGKTTLLRLLALLIKPDAGQVLFDGVTAEKNMVLLRRRIGYVMQANALFPELTVRENLRYWGCSGGDATALLGLDGVASKRVSALSGGMQRRLHLAIGLANDPALLIMDEPLTGVDIKTRQAILSFMTMLRGRGVTLIYSTHHADEIEGTADSLLLLKGGTSAHFGPIAALGGCTGTLMDELA